MYLYEIKVKYSGTGEIVQQVNMPDELSSTPRTHVVGPTVVLQPPHMCAHTRTHTLERACANYTHTINGT